MIIQQTGNATNAGSIAEQNVAVKQEVPVEQAKAQSSHAQAAVQETQQQPSSRQLHNAVDQVNKTIQTLSNDVQFTVDKETGKEIVKVVDRETKKVIRQIPSEEMVSIAKRLDELQGLIIRQKA
jgi:flagellar protein FlaG